jgi:hypothetical protein
MPIATLRRSAVLSLVAGCLGTQANAAVGNLPAGWSDVALIDPAVPPPKSPLAMIIAANAFGSQTKMLAPLPAPQAAAVATARSLPQPPIRRELRATPWLDPDDRSRAAR